MQNMMTDKATLTLRESISIGLLLFGLFFGAGNIIFPVFMGQLSAGNWLYSNVGFLITAIGLPILGVISFSLSKKENLIEYAQASGKGLGLFFAIALYLTIGPLFAIPRTATVAFEVGFSPYAAANPKLFLLAYSLIFFSLVLYFALKPQNILNVVGKFLAPLFIALISILLFACVLMPMGDPSAFEVHDNYQKLAVVAGLLDGYSTMDALASLAFGIIIVQNIRRLGVTEETAIAKETAKSGLVTIVLMAFIYTALAYLGATSLGIMQEAENGGPIIAQSAFYYFGMFGQLLLAAAITVACLKTAIGLVVSIGETFASKFSVLSYRVWAIGFTLVSFVIANFGLNTIISISTPVLMFLYPITIAYMFLWTINRFIPLKASAFKLMFIVMGLISIFDFLKASPEPLKSSLFGKTLLDFASQSLPLFDLALSWLIPFVIVLAVILIVMRKK